MGRGNPRCEPRAGVSGFEAALNSCAWRLQLEGSMKQIQTLLEGVYKRARDRGAADFAVMRHAEQLRVEKVAARKAAIKQRKELQKAKKAGVTSVSEGASTLFETHPRECRVNLRSPTLLAWAGGIQPC